MHQHTPFLFLLILAFVCFSCEPEAIQPEPTTPIDLAAKLADFEAVKAADLAEVDAQTTISPRSEVLLPAGSVDGLAAAIEEAGPGGTVRLESGPHSESATVTITQPIRLIGDDGAVLIIDSDPLSRTGSIVEPGLHVLNAPGTLIRNIEFRPASEVGGSAILLENSHRSLVVRNKIVDHENGILVHRSDRVYLIRNDIEASPLWLTGDIASSFGIIVVTGRDARVYSNKTRDAFCGTWVCDRNGYLAGNEYTANLYGIILCKVPDLFNYILPSGDLLFADISSTNWAVFGNTSSENLDTGFLIIDGADGNFLLKNTASNNGRIDFDFAGVTSRFGFETPTSFDNTGWLNNEETVVDCGENNRIWGGISQDSSDPRFCF